MKPRFKEVIESCVGRWYSILTSYGIDASHLRDVHGPCPVCGGKDRFRWDDKAGRGTFYCGGACGHGDGLDLLSAFTGKGRYDLIAELAQNAGMYEASTQKQSRPDPSKRIRAIYSESRELSTFAGGVVRKYLTNRGVPASKLLREHPALGYYEDGKKIGVYPAMVAPIMVNDVIASLHITYLTPDGKKADVPSVKKILTPAKTMDGGAIQLCAAAEEMGVAEGIETALAVMKLHSIPCWATATAGLMMKFSPPEVVKRLIIFGDNDITYTGQMAAYTLAHRLAKKGMNVVPAFPDKVNDFADVIAGLKND